MNGEIETSNKEQIIKIVDDLPEYKLEYVLAYLHGLSADEKADDEYCEQLLQNYLNDPSKDKDEEFTLEECKKEWGLD